MANDLTGDFDAVVEFAIPAANRVLAAMHRSERFFHSLTVRVVDTGPRGDRPTVVGAVDTFGDPITDQTRIGSAIAPPGQSFTAGASSSQLDLVVNTDLTTTVWPIVPSHLQGRAQLQLSPPTVEVPDGSGTNLRVRLPVMARYLGDPHTNPLAEFIRGELQLTAALNQIASQVGNVIELDDKADSVTIFFSPAWPNQPPLSAEEVAGINQAIRNALRTSFLDSNTKPELPPSIAHMQFKTLRGARDALAVLMNFAAAHRGDPGSQNNVFLGDGDDFAFALGRESIERRVRDHRSHRSFSVWPFTISLDTSTIELEEGRIRFTITGHASGAGAGFDFAVRQDLTLKLVATTAGGPLNTAELERLGDVVMTFSGVSILERPVAWTFKQVALSRIEEQRDIAIQDQQATVRDRFNVDKALGGFLTSLLNRPGRDDLRAGLAYSSFDITPSGIVLHGSLTVPDWPPAHVEFVDIPATGDGGSGPVGTDILPPRGPDYSALKSWIPGGTIERYEWSRPGHPQPFHTDTNKFVLIHPPPELSIGEPSTGAVAGFTPICLTVRGTRIASSGPAVAQPVSASVCWYSVYPVTGGLLVEDSGAAPLIALTQPGPGGRVEVTGHTSARMNGARSGSPNLIVHFADERSGGHLELLLRALGERGRGDAATAILAVLTADQLANARHTEGVIYAEEQDGAWARAFRVTTSRRPVTLIAEPNGNVVWRQEGELESATLAAALRRLLVRGAPIRRRMLRSSLRIGHPSPNFLFAYAPGRELTLRKLVGRPTSLVFWRSASKPSLEAVRDLPNTPGTPGGPLVLAINDGDAPEVARRAAAEHGVSAVVVTDPERRIALAYGVTIWPTIVVLDARGLVREIRYGRMAREGVK